MKVIRCAIGFLFVLITYSLSSQTVFGKPDFWTQLNIEHKFEKPWTIGSEFHYRMNDWVKKEQLLIRPYLTYNYRPWIDFTLGITYVNTFPYDEYPLAYNRPERNIWEQFMLKGDIGKFFVSHRFRYEQRNLSTLDSVNSEYNYREKVWKQRLRYRLTSLYPITDKLKAQFFDEVFINNGRQVLFDRNWFLLGLVYQFHPKANVQLGYLHQYAYINPMLYERHHGVLLMVFWNL